MVFGARVGVLACLSVGDKLKTENGLTIAQPNAVSMYSIGVTRGSGVSISGLQYVCTHVVISFEAKTPRYSKE
jgi:hypothetical protein